MTDAGASSAPPHQPWLHDLLVAVDGNATALSDRAGTMGTAPATGLFVDDRRVLSVLDIRLGEHPTAPVVGRAQGAQVRVWGSARHLGNAGADPTVEVTRTRTVRDGGLTEHLSVRSRADAPIETTVVVTLAGDGADLAAVKDGLPDGPLVPALVEGSHDVVVSWADARHVTTVRLDTASTSVVPGTDAAPTVVEVPLLVDPGATAILTLDVDTHRLARTCFDADSASGRADWPDARVEADDARLGRLVARSLDDLAHLLMDDPLDRRDVFTAAGTPWYLTLFGRDSLWAARLALPFSLDLAAGTLRVLARRQGSLDDPATAQAPGKILHEVRRDAPRPSYGTVDATALWVCLLHDAWRHGLPADDVRSLAPALDAALGWIERQCGGSPDGLVRYVDESGTGLANQGWKDSGDSMRCADGSLGRAPIALVEAQAYAAEAARSGATLGRALGIGRPQQWEELASTLADAVRATYWTDAGHLALALDGRGRLVDGIGSNMGHVLGTGVLTPQEAARVGDLLVSPELLGPLGISTLSRANPAYNPIGYHTGSVWTHDTAICALGLSREGLDEHACRVVRALVDAGSSLDDRWPELYSGEPVLGAVAPYPASCRPQAWSAASAAAVVKTLLGLDVDVPGRRVTLRPCPGAPFGALRVEGLRFGSVLFDVHVSRDGAVEVSGLPDDVAVVGP